MQLRQERIVNDIASAQELDHCHKFETFDS